MADIITTLHPDGQLKDNLYPNIKKENIPAGAIDNSKLADGSIDASKISGGSLEPIINKWLDNHPEATTSVQDHSISKIKLVESLANDIDKISLISESTNNLWIYGDKEFTGYIEMPVDISAGIYTLSAIVTTPEKLSRIYFYYTDDTKIYADFTPINNYPVVLNLTKNVNKVYIYAGRTYQDSTDKTATWKYINLSLGVNTLNYSKPKYITPYTAIDYLARNNDEKLLKTNLWGLGDVIAINYVEHPLQLNSGYYYLNGIFTTNTGDPIDVYVYHANGEILHDTLESNFDYQSIMINSPNNDITRIFFSSKHIGSYAGNILNVKNIVVNVRKEWFGYTLSSSQNWGILPYMEDIENGETSIDKVARKNISYWNGKRIAYNGDSVTQGIGKQRTGYVKYVNKYFNFDKVYNYAIGGTRLAHVNDVADCLVDRIQNMTKDVDIIFIMANTNDYASQVPIGTDDSTDINTYKGAMNSIFTYLKENYQTQTIIISTMLRRKINYEGGVENPIKIEEYAEAVRTMVNKYGFILYDAYNVSGLDQRNTNKDGSGISDDGLHPNETGAAILGRKISKFIELQ